jgi:hypothetical protein
VTWKEKIADLIEFVTNIGFSYGIFFIVVGINLHIISDELIGGEKGEPIGGEQGDWSTETGGD